MNLNQVTLSSKNLEISVPFYQTLGLKLIVLDLPNYARFECSNEATFSLHFNENTTSNNGTWIYFECNVDEEVKRLQKEGIQIEELPKDQPWLWREARISDPDGNVIILYHAGENRLNPPWRIKD